MCPFISLWIYASIWFGRIRISALASTIWDQNTAYIGIGMNNRGRVVLS